MRRPTIALTLAVTAALASPCAAQTVTRDARTAPRTEVSAVNLDFASGIKTTTLSDGTVYEEAFDPGRMRWIASKPDKDVVGSR